MTKHRDTDAGGKITKGPNYTPPALKPILERQSDEELGVFFDDSEWRVARSGEEARAQQIAEGLSGEEATAAEDWCRLPPERMIGMEDEGGDVSERRTCREWAVVRGPGLLGGIDR
jgi:hypothetical protein